MNRYRRIDDFCVVIFIVIVVLVSRGAKKSGGKAGQPAGA
jgi:hypothetical protein